MPGLFGRGVARLSCPKRAAAVRYSQRFAYNAEANGRVRRVGP